MNYPVVVCIYCDSPHLEYPANGKCLNCNGPLPLQIKSIEKRIPNPNSIKSYQNENGDMVYTIYWNGSYQKVIIDRYDIGKFGYFETYKTLDYIVGRIMRETGLTYEQLSHFTSISTKVLLT